MPPNMNMQVEGTGENSHYMTCQDNKTFSLKLSGNLSVKKQTSEHSTEETITVRDNSERFKQKSAQKKTETNSFKLQVNF